MHISMYCFEERYTRMKDVANGYSCFITWHENRTVFFISAFLPKSYKITVKPV